MCGIVGILSPHRERDADAIGRLCSQMADQLRHRGPNDAGTWVDAGAGLGLGHRRLSIIDLSPSGHQPMVSASERYVIAFNGEIYNFAQMQDELGQAGIRMRGRSDTEVLLEGIACWGLEQTLRRANGMFALAVWDRCERVLHLARDRLGQKPLYYGWAGRDLVFSSELKPFDVLPRVEWTVDRAVLTLFLRHGYVPEPHCIWAGFHKLAPATWLSIGEKDLGARLLPESRPYWSVRTAAVAGRNDPILDPVEAENQLDALLRDAVRSCMVSDVPLGAFLSGGIDSSTVVALMQAQSDRPVRTFTIGFREGGYDEAVHARAVARHLGTEHTEAIVTDSDARALIPSLPDIYDEPFADSSQIPTHLVSRLARQSVTVSLSGDGGDELFGGYNRYVWGKNVAQGIRLAPLGVRRALACGMRSLSVGAWDSLVACLPSRARLPQAGDKMHKLAGILESASQEQAYWRMTSLWQDPQAALMNTTELPTDLGDPARWPDGDFVERIMQLDAETYLPGDILAKLDRASMAVSLETRVPLLDHRVVELAWRMPLGWKIRHGEGKWPLRQLLYRHVPRALMERPKKGFSIPLADWLRGPLRDWAEALIEPGRIAREGYLEAAPIRRAWQQHQEGDQDHSSRLWCVLAFQSWLQEQQA